MSGTTDLGTQALPRRYFYALVSVIAGGRSTVRAVAKAVTLPPVEDDEADTTVETFASADTDECIVELDQPPTGVARDGEVEEVESKFDFDTHRREAAERYQRVRHQYRDCAEAAKTVLKAALEAAQVRVHTLESRAKDSDSFARKASRPSEEDPLKPRYPEPLAQITDLAGVRVITFLLDDLARVSEQVEQEFTVIEKIDKGGQLLAEDRLGYQSIHYLARFSPQRLSMPEYARHQDLVIEIQVRTILQHTWAELEHDIQYKAIETIPATVRRRFIALAGLLEIADREFQAVSDEDERVRSAALRDVELGDLAAVEVTQEALKAYLDQRLGPDGRMTDFSYEFEARILRRLGFTNLREIDDALGNYDDDAVSRILHGNRQGQLTRLEDVLLASMGETYIDRHPWTRGTGGESWRNILSSRLARLRSNGVPGQPSA